MRLGCLVVAALGLSGVPETPPVPFLDWGACPFECCTYGTWTARRPVKVHAQRRTRSRVVFTVGEGEAVEAQTGVVVTSQATRLVMRRELLLVDQASASAESSRARPGDVHLLTERGEGHFVAWHEGRILRSLDVSFLNGRACAQAPPADSCPGHVTAKGRSTWWIKLRNSRGQVGWTAEADAFGGNDACG